MTAPRHLLHLIETLDPASGGPCESVRALLTFAPPGYTSEVVTLDPPGSPFLHDYPAPVQAFGRPGHRTVYGYSPALYGWLRRNRHRFDGVLVHGLWQYCGLATWLAMRGRKPYVVFSHGMLDPYFKRTFPRKHLKKWAYWLLAEYWILRGAHRLLFTTHEESRLATQSFWLHRWRACVIPFGATRPPREGETLLQAFYAHLPQLRDCRFLLFLGRIHRKKGCDLLIEAFARHAALDPALHLVMAGPDSQDWTAILQQSVDRAGLSHRVHWPGMLKGDVKWGSFFAAEAFILPSHQENFGIAVAEALACGRPVLLADKVNIAQEIADDGAGLIQPDTQQGTDTLVRTWIDMPPAVRATMAEQALETFDRRYDMQQNTAAILHLFDSAPSRQT